MPRTRECDYCGTDIEPGTGTMFVRTDGSTVHFCSSKCEKNADLGREARNLEWTESGRDDQEPQHVQQEEAAEEPDAADLDEDEAATDEEADADTAGEEEEEEAEEAEA